MGAVTRRLPNLSELAEVDRRLVERDMAALAEARRRLHIVRRQLERAARGAPDRSATRLARKLLRDLSEVRT